LPVEVRELPDDLAALDGLLADPGLLAVIVEHWRREVVQTRRAVLTDGRPTIAMSEVLKLTAKRTSCWSSRSPRPGGWRGSRAGGRGPRRGAKLRAAAKLQELADRCEKVARQRARG
jgi:hypothetical protein